MVTPTNPDLFKHLHRRAKWQRDLSATEIEQVARELATAGAAPLTPTLIETLGWSNARQHRSLIDSFLKEPTDDEGIAQAALKVLCELWGETGDYLPYVIEYIQGKPWDETHTARYVALRCAGSYLKAHQQPELLHLMLAICESEWLAADERQVAAESLAVALGMARTAPIAQITTAAHERLHSETHGQPLSLPESFLRFRRLEQFLTQSKQGALDAAAVEAMLRTLAESTPAPDVAYLLINIAGEIGAAQHDAPMAEYFGGVQEWLSVKQRLEAYVANYLDGAQGWMLAKQALMVVCYLWGKTAAYLPSLTQFVVGVGYDKWGALQQTALGLAGRYLRQHSAPALLQAVLAVYENSSSGKWERAAAYEALATALGKSRQESQAARSADNGAALVAEVQARLAREGR